MIHTTIGIYPDGSKKINGVESKGLAYHIQYNITFRPGRAFFLDGICIHRGGFLTNRSEVEKIEEEIKNIKQDTDTKPYQ